MQKNKRAQGFTLLEILIALFVFTILSMLLVGALRSVINTSAQTDRNAERLRNLQMTLLILSRDVEQAVDRRILNASGKEEASFIGDAKGFTLTHAGVANTAASGPRSGLQRSAYRWEGSHLWRSTSGEALDQAPDTSPHQRDLLDNVESAHFEYVDNEGHLQKEWPSNQQNAASLPRAISVELTLAHWGEITQLYVIPAQPAQTTPVPGHG